MLNYTSSISFSLASNSLINTRTHSVCPQITDIIKGVRPPYKIK